MERCEEAATDQYEEGTVDGVSEQRALDRTRKSQPFIETVVDEIAPNWSEEGAKTNARQVRPIRGRCDYGCEAGVTMDVKEARLTSAVL